MMEVEDDGGDMPVTAIEDFEVGEIFIIFCWQDVRMLIKFI